MRAFAVWLLLFAAAATTVAVGVWQQDGWLDTDITHLVPADEADDPVDRALRHDRPGLSGELLVLIRGPADNVLVAAEAARDPLLATEGLALAGAGQDQALVQSLMPFRFGLLAENQRDAFRADPVAAYQRQVRRRLARPAPALGPAFNEDPAGLLVDWLSALPTPYPGFRETGGIRHTQRDGEGIAFLPLQLEGAFAAPVQEAVTAALATARDAVAAQCDDCELLATGPVLFANEQRERARSEITLLSSLSLTGILLLVLLAFRSPRPILLGVLALASGVLLAVATSLLIFGRVHAITLIAGTTLLGIAIDYVFKYLVHRSEAVNDSGASVVRRYRRPLLLGVASSLLSLIVLAMSPLPVMRELAVFSAAGLAGAWLTVVLAFPRLDGAGAVRLSPRVAAVANALPARLAAPPSLRWLIVVLVLPLGGVAFFQMPGNDDLRDFQSPMPERLAVDATVRDLTGTAYPGGFFVVTGPDADTVLRREAELMTALDEAAGHHRALALSRFMPPVPVQAESRRLVGEALNSEVLAALLSDIGMGEPAIEALRSDWRASEGTYLQPGAVSEGPVAELVDGLWLADGDPAASLVIPRGGADAVRSAGLADGVRFVQPVERMNEGLGQQREGATRWILTAAVIGMPLLFLLILGIRRGLTAVAAPLTALAATLAFLWLAGIGMNTFVLMGVILALGVGADYAAFLAAEKASSRAGVTGIALAALTSLLAFGLLGLSGIPALRDFGLTVVAGILSAWLAAFILVGIGGRNES